MAVLVYLVLFLALTGHSSALYCVCKDGMSDQVLQKALDYACGAGADCSPILQTGACYSPNTVKNHCDYAVNSYFQKKGQAQGSCDFAGTATSSQTAPTGASTACVYPATSQTGTSTTPSTSPSTTTPSTTTPSTSTTPTTTPTSSTPTTTTGTTPSVFGTGPTSSGGTTGINDSGSLALMKATNLFLVPVSLTFLSVLLWG